MGGGSVTKDPEFAVGPLNAGKRPRTKWFWLTFAFGLTMAAVLGYMLLGGIQSAREAARRAQCLCNLCQLSLALHNYHAEYDSLPPGFGVDDAGLPRVSWRVALLPFMEQSALYNSYNFSQPWDSPANLKLVPQMPNGYVCPSREPAAARRGMTSYVLIRGPGTMFPGAQQVKFDDVKDGLSQTLAIVEVVNVDIPWTAPIDLDAATMSFVINDPARPSPSSNHPGGVNAALADGGLFFLKESTSRETLRALISINGGEAIDIQAVTGRASK